MISLGFPVSFKYWGKFYNIHSCVIWYWGEIRFLSVIKLVELYFWGVECCGLS